MFESMYAAKGVGLAAPQIGIAKRIAVIDLSVAEDPQQKIVLINPEIIHKEGTQDRRGRLPQPSRFSRAGERVRRKSPSARRTSKARRSK